MMVRKKADYTVKTSTENWSEGPGRYEVYPYTGHLKLRHLKGAVYKLIGFFSNSWAYDDSVNAYLKDLFEADRKITLSHITEYKSWKDQGLSGNIVSLRQEGDPAFLTGDIEGIWEYYAPEGKFTTARAMIRAGKRFRKIRRTARRQGTAPPAGLRLMHV